MPDGLTALVAFHDSRYTEIVSSMLARRGYAISTATNVSEFETQCTGRDYNLYAMDVNLGFPNKNVFDAVFALYERIREEVETGSILFYPCSGSSDVVDDARNNGLPCLTKVEIGDKIRVLPIPSQ